MDKYYLFSKKVTHAVKVSITLAISLLLFAFGQAAVGHESGYSPTGANAPNMLAPNVDVGIGQTYASLRIVKPGMVMNQTSEVLNPLTITSIDAGRFYDGTTTATLKGDQLKNVVLGGIVTGEEDVQLLELTGTFADKNASEGKTFTITGFKLGGLDAYHYDLTQGSIKANIKPAELILIGLTVDDKVYDGTPTAKLNYISAAFSGFMFPGDGVTVKKIVPTATFDTKNAGDVKTVTVKDGSFKIGGINLHNEYNYTFTIQPLTANITPRPLIVSATCIDKVYDHAETALSAMITLKDNRVTGESFNITYTGASFATDDAGIAIPVTVAGISITPALDAANYTVNGTALTSANITPKAITILGVTAVDKVYDDNNRAVLAGTATLSDVLGSDVVTIVTGIGTYANEVAGENKDVTFSGFSLDGTDKNNYSLLVQPISVLADIDKRPLNITAVASDKEYDAKADATVTLSDDRLSGNIFDILYTSTFADVNVANQKTVTVSSISLNGSDAMNYELPVVPVTAQASITPVHLTISDVVGKSKDYDGTLIAPFDYSAAHLEGGMIGTDNVSLNKVNVTGTFADKNVGVGKPVTIGGFEIADLNFNKINYIITQPSDIIASIVPVVLSVNAVGLNKEYDGKTIAEVILTPDPVDLVVGDVLAFSYSGDFTDKNVANGITVNVKDIVISSGNEAGNYTLEYPTETTTANITQKVLSVDAVAESKVYDGDHDAVVILTPDPKDVAVGEVLTLDFTDAHFSDKNAALGKTVTVEGISIKTGNEAGNYILEYATGTGTATATAKADITQLNLTVDALVKDKVYNSDTDVVPSTVTLDSQNKVVGDDLNYAFGTATFSDENVGDRTVLVAGIEISGNDVLNYSLQNQTKTATAKITPKDLTVTAVGSDKVYDGLTKAVVTLSTNDMVEGDDIGYDYNANFDVKDVDETAKVIPIAVTNITLTGTDAGNYKITNANASTTAAANITPRELIITGVTAADKSYNRNTVVDNWNTDNALLEDKANPELDLVKKENVTLITSEVTAAFTDENAGLKTENYTKKVQFAGFKIVGDPNEYNYSLVQPSASAKIIPVNLRITGVKAADKIYDGNRVATLNTGSPDLKLVGLLTGDETVTLVSSAAIGEFAVKDVAEYQKVTTKDFSLDGTNSGNYEILQPVTIASITDQTLVLTATSQGKIYDSNNNDVTVTLNGWAANDDVRVTSYKALYDDENVADNIPITVSDIVLEGVDLKNYNIPAGITAHTTASITSRTLKITGVTAVDRSYNSTVLAILDTQNADFDPADYITGDDLQLVKTAATGTFEDKDVANGITVTTQNFTLEGSDKDNYSLVQPSTVADITPAILTISDLTAISKIYDGTVAANLNSVAVLNGVFASDAAAVTLDAGSATGSFVDKKAGLQKFIIVDGFTLVGDEKGDYSLTQPEYVKADITKKALTVSATVNSKPYDGNAIATISENGLTIEGMAVHADGVEVVNPDYVSATALFESKDADEAKDVAITGIQLIGTDADNYTWNSDAATKADITFASLKVTGLTANDKTYDGNKTAEVTGTATLDGVKGSDNVMLSSNGNVLLGNFTDKNVGTKIPVIVTGTVFDIEGADVLNYILDPLSLTANINPIKLTISGVTANHKVYDGNKSAELLGTAKLEGVIVANEIVTLDASQATGTFANKNVGNQEVTTIGYVLAGADVLSNYTLTQPSVINADITTKLLTVTATAANKVYDGNTLATVTFSDDRLLGDILTPAYTTATFDNKNAGTNKPVAINGITISGADALNYISNTTATTNANISSVGLTALTITGVTVNTKVYDGSTTATLNLNAAALSGVISPDVVTLNNSSAAATFTDMNVGTGKAVSTSGFVIEGADAGNYSLANLALTTDITAKELTITPNSISKCFEATPTLSNTAFTPVGLLGNDAVTSITVTSDGALATAAVGTYGIVASNAVGTGLSNYSLNFVNGTLTVTPAQAIPVVTIDNVLQVTLTSDATTGNQWYKETALITGATAQTYTAPSNGNYYVMVTGNCSTIKSNTVNVTHVSVPEFEKPTISVYPNPSKGEFWLKYKASGNEKLKMIQLYNRLGKAVYQAAPSSVTNDLTEWVSIKNQPVGVYILVLTTDNQRISRQIVITK